MASCSARPADAEDAGKGGSNRLALDRGLHLSHVGVGLLECGCGGVIGGLRHDLRGQELLRPLQIELGEVSLRLRGRQLGVLLPVSYGTKNRACGFARDPSHDRVRERIRNRPASARNQSSTAGRRSGNSEPRRKASTGGRVTEEKRRRRRRRSSDRGKTRFTGFAR